MYIPKPNILTDKNEALDFIKKFSFGTIITSKDNSPTATHLPFLVNLENEKIILTSHFAKANRQWKDIEENKVLTIFSEPHAYISPTNYQKDLNVPTWNYIAIHTYGKGRLITDSNKVIEVLERTIINYEESYKIQWDSLPNDYKEKMSNGIVAFEIEVDDLQAKKKLSQNKTEIEQKNIINSLSQSHNTNENLIADYMKKELK
ncbi:MAG: transcriptional regulator [Flavobacteriales bacterium]|nr:transcriptional regulator [Flavobacteriales bacterium]|tara:strand:- start:650 stop:1261 length:612 start_codon:yes stop_codon:yes gene_type:complete